MRRAVRHERRRPLVEDLSTWLATQRARLPGGSPIAEAFR